MRKIFTALVSMGKWMGQSGLAILAWGGMTSPIQFFAVGGVTPPGAPGVSLAFFVWLAASCWFLHAASRYFSSAAPTVGTAAWIAAALATLPFHDSRTGLRLEAMSDAQIWVSLSVRMLFLFGILLVPICLGRQKRACPPASDPLTPLSALLAGDGKNVEPKRT